LKTHIVGSRRISREKSIFNNKQYTHFRSLKLHPAETMPFAYDEASALTAEVRVFDPWPRIHFSLVHSTWLMKLSISTQCLKLITI